MRRLWVWLLTVPLSLVGVESAHALGNALFGSPTGDELFASQAAFRGDLGPTAAALAALVAIAVISRVTGSWSTGTRFRALPFALLAPVAFLTLELAEAASAGHVGLAVFTAPAFSAGLALQVPFGAIAYVVARSLLRIGDAIRRVLRVACTRRRQSAVVFRGWFAAECAPRSTTFWSRRNTRGPPLHLSV